MGISVTGLNTKTCERRGAFTVLLNEKDVHHARTSDTYIATSALRDENPFFTKDFWSSEDASRMSIDESSKTSNSGCQSGSVVSAMNLNATTVHG